MKFNCTVAGAAWGFLGVLLGAFGAHALDLEPEAKDWWDTATFYQMVHAVVVVLGSAQRGEASLGTRPFACMLLGSVIFSATLYAMALGAPRFLGAITPLGGLFMLVGWAWLAVASARRPA